MNEDVTIETIYQVWVGSEGVFLQVLIDGDGMVRINTKDQASENYFGKIDISLEPRVAKKLAEAIKTLT